MPHEIDRPKGPAARRLTGLGLALLLGLSAQVATAPLQVAEAQQKAAPRQAQQQPAADPGEKQLADLQKRLAITPAQQPQFDAFAQAIRQNAKSMQELIQQQQQSPPKNAVEDLRVSTQMAQAEVDGMKRLLPTVEALYASLSDQQKKVADKALAGGDQGPPQQQAPRKR